MFLHQLNLLASATGGLP